MMMMTMMTMGSPVIILSASFLRLLRTATMRTIKIATKQTMSLVSRIYNGPQKKWLVKTPTLDKNTDIEVCYLPLNKEEIYEENNGPYSLGPKKEHHKPWHETRIWLSNTSKSFSYSHQVRKSNMTKNKASCENVCQELQIAVAIHHSCVFVMFSRKSQH